MIHVPDKGPLCMTNLPRTGWQNLEVVDNGHDNMTLCPWCERQEYRYGHLMSHPEVFEVVEIGCVCAEKIAEGYDGRAAERHLRAHAERAYREQMLRHLRAQAERRAAEAQQERLIETNKQLERVVNEACWLPSTFGKCSNIHGFRVEIIRSKFGNGTYRVEVGRFPHSIKSEWVRQGEVVESIRRLLRQKGAL